MTCPDMSYIFWGFFKTKKEKWGVELKKKKLISQMAISIKEV